MYIQISCSKCSQAIAPGQSGVMYTKVVTLNELGTFVLECPAGHTSTTVLRTPKHEVLYLIASNAILDGHLRDAVLSFHGAMERYFEFALRVIARSRNIPLASFEFAWKLVASQSERQFGAFVLTWLFENGDSFADVPLLAIQKQSQFRNAVVHKGAKTGVKTGVRVSFHKKLSFDPHLRCRRSIIRAI